MAWLIFRAAKAVRDLEERVAKVERDSRSRELEAEDLYEKVRHALGRISKRTAPPEAVDGHDDPARPPHIDAKSWDIIRKRRGGVGPTNRGSP